MSGAAAMLCLPCKACSSGRGRIAQGRAGNTPRLAWCDSTGRKQKKYPLFESSTASYRSVDDFGRPVDKRGIPCGEGGASKRNRVVEKEKLRHQRRRLSNGQRRFQGPPHGRNGGTHDSSTEGRRRAGIFAGLVAVAAGLVFVLAAATASLPGSNFEIDASANLIQNDPSPSLDWASASVVPPAQVNKQDTPSGQNDDSYSGSTKEDSICPAATTGS